MRILKKVSDEFWWEVARACNYATFYHTPIWKELAERLFPNHYRNETFGAILPSGVRVVFPLGSKRRLGPMRWLMSTVEGCYGSFIADGPVSPAEALALYHHACTWTDYSLHILDNPIGPALSEEIQSKLTLLVNETAYTLKLDTSFDTIFARFSTALRDSYQSGISKGVQVRPSASLDDYQAYYANHANTGNRWGKEYDWNLFEQIYHLSQIYPDQIKLWLITVNEQIIGGRIIFYWGQQATWWNGTVHQDFLSYNPKQVGDTEIIRDALARGFSYFDFNTSALDKTIIAYKEQFGAEGVPVNLWRFENPILKPAQQLYRQIKRTSKRSSTR